MHHAHPIPVRRTAAWGAATLLACSLLPGLAWAQTAAPAHTASAPAAAALACVQVDVQSLRPGQGYLMLAAYGSADSFGKQPLAARRVAVGEAQMRIEWCGLTGEAVALMGYQDLDSDGKMGRNLVGIPTEPWGSSGQPGSFGPSWETGRVPLNGQAIVVRMSQ
jgi:uncharacterized protein (DUF2141 family)